jgi:hypothetical protein
VCVYRYEKFYTVVQEKILADYGKKFDRTLKAKMMGKKALEAGKIFVQETGLDGILSPKDFIERQGTMLHDMFPESDLMPGIFSSLRFSIYHAVARISPSPIAPVPSAMDYERYVKIGL